MVKRIAIILARGGSKRITNKNIKEIDGIPMITYTINAAISSKKFSRILVSTDDKQIRQISIENGAEVPFLRNKAIDDHASATEATLAALEQAERWWKEEYEEIIQLMANCPTRNGEDIRNAIDNFEEKKVDAQISCVKFGWQNPWWATYKDSDGKPNWIFKKLLKKRSQDLDELYCPTGAIWIAKRKTLIEEKTFYSSKHILHEMEWQSSIDIDNIEDLEFAETIVKMRKEKVSTIKKQKRILIIAAHPDDEVLGCGGMIAKESEEGNQVYILIAAEGEESRHEKGDENVEKKKKGLKLAAIKAAKILGAETPIFMDLPDNRLDSIDRLEITKRVEKIIEDLIPDTIYVHHAGDLNIDHRRLNEAALTACRPIPEHSVKCIKTYEVASSTEWRPMANTDSFVPNNYINISKQLDKKLMALSEYHEEMRKWPHARSIKAIEHLARWRGAQVGVEAAEAFVILREIQ